jgi:FkbM family methyltransferase
MPAMILKILRFILSVLVSGRFPSRRALAALFKLHGLRLKRRWPFIIRSGTTALNLGFEDILEFQYARSRHFIFLNVGAFDGLENDPISQFVRSHACSGIFVEPQPEVFKRLYANLGDDPKFSFLNAAVDEVSAFREIYYVPAGIKDLPIWTEQLASFNIEHLLRHEERAPGLSRHILKQTVQTTSFEDLLNKFALDALDVLQIDAEGMDAKLLTWFPFERIKPSVLHYEAAHMSAEEQQATRARLECFGYIVREADSPLDNMAVLI